MNWFAQYWPVFVSILAVLIGGAAAIHAAMTKDEVRAALGWAAVAILSPFVGATVYAVAGVNRIRRSRVRKRRGRFDRAGSTWDQVTTGRIADAAALHIVSLKRLGDTVAAFPYTDGNYVTLLEGGDETYPAMLEAIASAQKSIAFQSYILDDDPVGRRFVAAFAEAKARGVEVRILLDAVGVRYSRPPIIRRLRDADLDHGLFMGNFLPMRLPYANLRTHRKLLIVDGSVGFTGGMNVRDEFTTEFAGEHVARDTHFRLEGPVVSQLLHIFSGDWLFTTGEKLTGGDAWRAHSPDEPGPVPCRPIDSGPDDGLERTHAIILGALAVAEERIRISTPYFLPDSRLTSALATAARRGIQVDVVLPKKGNLRLIDWAVAGQLEQVLIPGCRVWRSEGAFDHSKLMVVDGAWALVGSSNLDPRSLRLNFELDIEIMHRPTALIIERRIEAQIANAHEETLETLRQRAFPVRFRNRVVWLASPYL